MLNLFSWRRWWYRLWNVASTYLPLSLMALLALGTWWLVKHAPIIEAQQLPSPPVHEPDYAMSQFTVHRFDAQGVLRTMLGGAQGRHYPDNNTLEVDDVRLRAVGLQGEITTARARYAWSNHDGSEVRLRGDAVVMREAWGDTPGVTFQGESLRAMGHASQLSSTEPVTIERAGLRVDAATLDYDHRTQVAQTRGKVNVVFNSVPKSAAASALSH